MKHLLSTLTTIVLLILPLFLALQTERGEAQTLSSLLNSSGQLAGERIESGTKLEEGLQRIEQKFDVVFLYRTEVLDGHLATYSFVLPNRLSEALNILLDRTGLEVKYLNPKTYGIYESETGIKSVDVEVDVIQEMVRGTVTDAESGEPIPGVNILVQGTESGATTDVDGEYELSVPSLNATLRFTYIGYSPQIVSLDGRNEVDIEMSQQAIVGEEMVVTAFGIEREAKSLAYSTQSVSTSEVSEARELNVMSSLQGKVSGLSVTSAGTGVGASTRVVLRGNRSISGDSQPLYVVDGVPINGNPQDINPDDIASINVLKGPNAAALYGSAAQNGVIVISTNQAQPGVVNVSLNNTFMVDTPIITTKYQNEYGQGAGGVYNPGSEFSWGPRMDGQMVQHWSPDPNLSGTQYAMSPQPNNVRNVFRRGYNLANNLTASIGGESTQTVFSYTHTDAQGILPGNDLNRHNVTVRVTSQLRSDLTLDSRVTYMRQQIDNELSQGGSFSNPMRQIYRLPRSIHTSQMRNFEYINQDGERRQNYWNPGSNGGANPYWTLNRNLNEITRERILTMASLTYNINETMDLMVRGAYDGSNTSEKERFYNDSYVIADFGEYGRSMGNQLEWNGDVLLSYSENITEDFDIDANVGGNILQRRNASLSANTGTALTVPNFFTLSNTQNVMASENVGSPRDTYSVYGSSQFGWRNTIFLNVTGRNDWSSTLPADNRSYFYPSIGLSAVLSDLIPSFPEFFSFARIRTSWAQVGSSAPPYMIARTANFSSGGTAGFLRLSNTLPNEDLKPEQTKSFEVGLDMRFYQGRLGLDLTYYKTNTENQLFTVTLPSASGASEFFTNGGDVENEGIEVLLATRPVETTRFLWELDFNFGTNRNMVNRISDERPRVVISSQYLRDFVIEEGQPYGQLYVQGFERDSQGRILVASNGVPRITNGKTLLAGSFNPDWMGGISNRFSYRNFSASFLIDHRQGGIVVSNTNALTYADGVTEQTLQGRDGSLVFGENFYAHETAVLDNGSPNNIAIDAESFWRAVGGRNNPSGELFIDEATNTRLREVTLGYRLPASAVERLPFSGVKISLVGRNLMFLYKASENLDPDLMVGTGPDAEGFESFAPPTTRSFGMNLKVDF
ncbi:MAG: SusC/RagA family TonB-linked outer membrane protein [Balneolaceae bacterium]